jgi:UDP-N-acetylmuramoyl-L-alanyl-D-glutamate--2,6-diaminopimelate ligase
MKFSEMITSSEIEITDLDKSFDFEVNKLCYSSKDVEKNDIFFAIKGYKTDGNAFIPDAINRGAMAVISDNEAHLKDPRTYYVPDCRKTMAELSSIFFGTPSKKMKMVGVTGTNGKTTVTNIIYHVLQSLGCKTGLIGTNGNYINKRFLKTEHTTPESVDLNKLLKEMADEQVEYAVMEVSSHSLYLKRVHAIEFDLAIFMRTWKHILKLRRYCLTQ